MLLRALLVSVVIGVQVLPAQTTKPAPSNEKPAVTSEKKSSTPKTPEEIEKTLVLWHDRAERFTSASLEDEWAIGAMQEVLHARLAEAWWKTDPVRAHAWLHEAVINVTLEQKNEPEDRRKQRIKAVEIIFRVCERLKMNQYSKQLLDYLMAEAIKQGPYPGTQHYSGEVASAIREAATQAGQNDPSRAAELGNQLVKLHSGDTILQTLDMIRYKDEQAANRLYTNALTTAATSSDYPMAFSLMQYPFPFHPFPGPDVSASVKTFSIDTLGSLLSQPLNSPDQQKSFCQGAPLLAQHMLPYLPPAQQGVVQASVQTCKADTPEDEDQHDDLADCDTADSCLKLAETVTTAERRARLKSYAANRARDEKNPMRSLAILDSLTDEEREWIPEWTNDYWLYGTEAMEQLYKIHDSQSIQRLIDRAPDQLRAQMIISLVEQREVRDDKPYATAMVTEARRVLEKFPTDNPSTYLETMNFYSDLLPQEAPQAFGFVTSALNQITYMDFEKENDKNKKAGKERPLFGYPKPGRMLEPVMINATLVEQDEPYITAAIKTLSDPETRIAFRLTFLRYSLKRYEQELKEKEKLHSPAPTVNAAAAKRAASKTEQH
jgi:hypothetical protein